MSQTELREVVVTQEDREAAAAIYAMLGFGPCQHIIDGMEDDIGVVPEIARHRTAALSAALPLIREEALREAAEIAADAAREAGRIGELHPQDSDSRSRMFARSREAWAIHDAILALIPTTSPSDPDTQADGEKGRG